MKRRSFLAGATTAAAAATVSAPAIAQGMKKLTMVTSWPNDLGLGRSAIRLAEAINAMAGGRLQIEVQRAGELVEAFEVFEAVSEGIADMYHSAEYYWQKQSPAFSFFASVPFGLTANEMNAWIYHGGGQALWDELAAGFNLKPLLVANTGVQMGGWFTKEVNSIDSYKKLRHRMPGLGGEVLKRLGAVVVNVSGGKVVASMQSGAIDASEWVGPYMDHALGLHKAAKFYYYPGFHEPGTALSLGINRQVWEDLSPELQSIVTEAAAAENARSVAEFNAQNAVVLRTLTTEHGIELRKFPDSILTAIGKLSGEVVAEIGQSDPLTKRVYDSYLRHRRDAIEWSNISEREYMNARSLDFPYG